MKSNQSNNSLLRAAKIGGFPTMKISSLFDPEVENPPASETSKLVTDGIT